MRSRANISKSVIVFTCIIASLALTQPIPVASSGVTADIPPLPDNFASTAGSVDYVATSPALPGVMFANIKGRLPRYSLNGGMTWNEIAVGSGYPVGDTPSVVALAPRPDNPQNPIRLLIGVTGTDHLKTGIYRSGDFGSSWVMMAFPQPSGCNIWDIITGLAASPVDPSRIYFTKYCDYWDGFYWGAFGTGYTSNDSGLSFTEVISRTYDDVFLPSPVLAQRVYFKNGGQVSDNAGSTWAYTGFFSPNPESQFVQDGLNTQKLYMDGYYTDNGGASWIAWVNHPCPDANLQYIADPEVSGTLYIRCNEGLYRSQNNGNDWIKLSEWHGNWIGPDYSTSPYRILWARDDGLWISSDHGENWSHLTDNYAASLITPWKNGALPDSLGDIQGFAPFSVGHAWAVSKEEIVFGTYRSHILHWNGVEWDRVGDPILGSLNSIAFDGQVNGWVVGNGLAMHWGGTTWQPVDIRSDASLSSVDVAGNTAWAVGAGGTIMKAVGLDWSDETSPTPYDLYSVDIVSQDDVWAGGGFYYDITGDFDGVLLHKNALAWSIVHISDQYIFPDISALSSNDAWAVGAKIGWSHGAILHWDGNSWIEIQAVDHELYSITMISPTDGWVVGNNTLLHWDGLTWTEIGRLESGCCSAASAAVDQNDAWFSMRGWKLSSPIVHYYNLPDKFYLPSVGR